MSTTTVKWFTALMLIACAALFVGWPAIMGPRPGPGVPTAEAKAYAVRFVTMLSVIVLFLILAAAGAVVIMRRTLAELREQQMENMRDLVESTLESQRKRSGGDAQQS